MTSRPEKIRWLRKGEPKKAGDYFRCPEGSVSRVVCLGTQSKVHYEAYVSKSGHTTGYFRFERATRRKARKTGRGRK